MVSLDPTPLDRRIRTSNFLNKTLQNICANEGMRTTGNKQELQNRIIERIHFYTDRANVDGYENIKNLIEGHGSSPHHTVHRNPPAAPPPSYHGPPYQPAPLIPGIGIGYGQSVGMPGFKNSLNFTFKPSPFYEILEQLGEMRVVDIMQNNRHSIPMKFSTSTHPIMARISNDPTMRVMVFCSQENHGRQDVAFPHQSELKVNNLEFKANLRGLKNKPGSTRPVDITKEIRFKPATYTNSVELTYALTSKAGNSLPRTKYYMVMYVVQTVPVETLVAKLEGGKRITKESVLSDMAKKASDPDIIATASILSLKCPLSTLRLGLPVRSISCRHNQCFDATSFLQLQEQGPTWVCPICNNSATYESLVVDEYVRSILKSTSKSTEQVNVEPNGEWKIYVKPEASKPAPDYDFDDDEDLVEVTKTGSSSVPPPPQNGSTGTKRAISSFIDLTSSGDEDEESRPAKRQLTSTNYGAGSGYGTPPNGPYRESPLDYAAGPSR